MIHGCFFHKNSFIGSRMQCSLAAFGKWLLGEETHLSWINVRWLLWQHGAYVCGVGCFERPWRWNNSRNVTRVRLRRAIWLALFLNLRSTSLFHKTIAALRKAEGSRHVVSVHHLVGTKITTHLESRFVSIDPPRGIISVMGWNWTPEVFEAEEGWGKIMGISVFDWNQKNLLTREINYHSAWEGGGIRITAYFPIKTGDLHLWGVVGKGPSIIEVVGLNLVSGKCVVYSENQPKSVSQRSRCNFRHKKLGKS